MSEMFGTIEEKQNFLKVRRQSVVMLKIEPALPCTSQDCLNAATVASAAYNPDLLCWDLVATCKNCLQKMARMYGVTGDE